MLQNLTALDDTILLYNGDSDLIAKDKTGKFFTDDEDLISFCYQQTHASLPNRVGFYFEMHGRHNIDGYKARHKKFREDLHPSVSLHTAVGGSALIGEAGVVFRLHPRANRNDLAEQIATKLKQCKQTINTLALRNKANSEAPFSGLVPPFKFVTRKVHYKPDRSTRFDQWPSVDVLQFAVHPAHVQFMSALILNSIAQDPKTLMRGKYYVPRFRESSSGLADLCLAAERFHRPLFRSLASRHPGRSPGHCHPGHKSEHQRLHHPAHWIPCHTPCTTSQHGDHCHACNTQNDSHHILYSQISCHVVTCMRD